MTNIHQLHEFHPGDKIKANIDDHHIVIFRNAFSQHELEEEIAQKTRDFCSSIVIDGSKPWPKNWTSRKAIPLRYPEDCLAGELDYEYIDGETVTAQRLQNSIIYKLLKKSYAFSFFEQVSQKKEFDLAAARIRYTPVNHHDISEATLPIHQDQYTSKFYTLWVPLIPPGMVTNEDTAGIRLLKNKVDYHVETDEESKFFTLPHIVKDLVGPNEETAFFRPKLRLGDLLIFQNHVLHGTHVPETATTNRISYDFRFDISQ